MKMSKKILVFTALLFCFLPLSAESATIDFLRSTGKIYSVIAVICSILIGLGIYLFTIDRKLTKIENQINNEQ